MRFLHFFVKSREKYDLSGREEKSPEVEGAQLSHLSGNSTKGAIELCFHWVVPQSQDSVYAQDNYDDV